MSDATENPEQEVLPDGFAWDYETMGRGPYPCELPPGPIVEAYLARTPEGSRGVNLGCGGATFEGWLNIDSAMPWHLDLLHDLAQGLPMIPERSMDAVYSEHFMEHIPRKTGLHLMRECSRVLRPGGRLRIAMPDLDDMVENYRLGAKMPAGDTEFDEFFGGMFHTTGEWMNIAMRAWGHTYIYNFEDLRLLLMAAGFEGVIRQEWGLSADPNLRNRETRDPSQSSLIVEAAKPTRLATAQEAGVNERGSA